MKKIGLAVTEEQFEELKHNQEKRGMGNINELIRYYLGKALIDDAKYFTSPPAKPQTSQKKK